MQNTEKKAKKEISDTRKSGKSPKEIINEYDTKYAN